MTIIKLSETDIAYLQTLKDSGRHREYKKGHHNEWRIHTDTLLDVFAEACRLKQIRYFKTSWFTPAWSSLRNHGGGMHNDLLNVLGRGQILNCVKHGNSTGVLEKVSSYRWGWKNLE